MLTIETTDRVRVLTFNRPEVLNAFDSPMYDAVAEALNEAMADPAVAVVILTGAGRAFCAGQDLAEMASGAAAAGEKGPGFPRFMKALIHFDKPLIAAVNGLGVGLGATMLAHCDLVFMAESARLRVPFTRLGVVPEAGSSYLFPARMGWQAAAHFLLSSDWLDAPSAVDCGLAWQVVSDVGLLDASLRCGRDLARRPITSLVESKRLMKAARGTAIADAVNRELDVFPRMVGTPINIESLTAFLEKREPDFRGIDGA
jgi:enoyl-CoA hydratase/carnithine racemase